MPIMKTLMPIKQNGKIVETGSEIEVDVSEVEALENNKIATLLTELEVDDFDLVSELSKLIADEHDITNMSVKDINNLITQKATRADIDAALEIITLNPDDKKE